MDKYTIIERLEGLIESIDFEEFTTLSQIQHEVQALIADITEDMEHGYDNDFDVFMDY